MCHEWRKLPTEVLREPREWQARMLAYLEVKAEMEAVEAVEAEERRKKHG